MRCDKQTCDLKRERRRERFIAEHQRKRVGPGEKVGGASRRPRRWRQAIRSFPMGAPDLCVFSPLTPDHICPFTGDTRENICPVLEGNWLEEAWGVMAGYIVIE
ncbi:hypothetical protein ElyMa_006042300 [Elysia marginata]|uniref:Uncharacterized protein n=1 Tax=Elysia marginata TaxID=1093978 RepID=A0AAV4GLT3_9GAST|nr:hypothetical protein ElyMa_006042300 [Elysia marginata]